MRRRVGRAEDLGAEGKGGVWGVSRTASEAVETAAEEDEEAVEEGERDGRTTLYAYIKRNKIFFFFLSPSAFISKFLLLPFHLLIWTTGRSRCYSVLSHSSQCCRARA